MKKNPEILCYIIAYPYIAAAVLNDGWSGAFFAIPFVIFVILSSIKSYSLNNKKLIAINFVFLALASFTYLSDKSDWSIIYHAIGDRVIVTKNIEVSHSKGFPLKMIWGLRLDYQKEENEIYPTYNLKKNDSFLITNVFVTSNPDLGIRHIYKIQPSSESFNSRFMNNAKKIRIDWSWVGKGFKKLPLNSPYISSYVPPEYGLNYPSTGTGYGQKHLILQLLDMLLVIIFLFPALIIFIISWTAAWRSPKTENNT